MIKYVNEEVELDPIIICPRCPKYQYQVLRTIEKDPVRNTFTINRKKKNKEEIKKARKKFIMQKVVEFKKKEKKSPLMLIDLTL